MVMGEERGGGGGVSTGLGLFDTGLGCPRGRLLLIKTSGCFGNTDFVRMSIVGPRPLPPPPPPLHPPPPN